MNKKNSMIDNTGINYYQDTEHYLQRVLAGNINNVRRRLTLALERLDYDFVDEGDFEIQAKRNMRGWAGAGASADVLDYSRTLIIKFKPLSENLTQASFIYIVKHPWLQRGEKEVLTREAETISSLATVRAVDKICAVCGTESADDSRFCRKCGATMTSDENSLEILRMTAETRSGHTSVVIGTIFGILMLLLNIAGLIAVMAAGVANKGVNIFLLFGIFISLFAVISNGFGWKRLNNALRANDKNNQLPKIRAEQSIHITSGEEPNALPAPPAYSVTEATTNLLNSEGKTVNFVKRRTNDER